MDGDLLPRVTPGDVLRETFLDEIGLTQHRLAVLIGVPPRRINEIVLGKRRITADTSIRLGRFFHLDDEFWLRLQDADDIEAARQVNASTYDAIEPWPLGENGSLMTVDAVAQKRSAGTKRANA